MNQIDLAIQALRALPPKRSFILSVEQKNNIETLASTSPRFYVSNLMNLMVDMPEHIDEEEGDAYATLTHMIRHLPLSRWQLMRLGLTVALMGRCQHRNS